MPDDLWHVTYREFFYIRQGFLYRDDLDWLKVRRLYGGVMNKGLKKGKPDDYWWDSPFDKKKTGKAMSNAKSYKAARDKFQGYVNKLYGRDNSKTGPKEAKQAD